MASAAIKDALMTFLAGDAGDVRVTVNAEQAALLAAGSVYEARAASGPEARKANALPLVVEVVHAAERDDLTVVGIGIAEVLHDVDLVIVQRRKDVAAGATQLGSPEKIRRALVRRYSGVTNLAISVAASLATFRWARAQVLAVDAEPDVAEIVRAIVRVTFAFTEALAANT